MSEHTVFIGGGNMGRSLIGGMIAAGASPDTLAVVELDAAKRAALEQDFGAVSYTHLTLPTIYSV